uniref:Uncharacterized protein n=1 Tax=Glossina austeni TaxID=7395 RepID=A0A1A9VHI9_GLOAU
MYVFMYEFIFRRLLRRANFLSWVRMRGKRACSRKPLPWGPLGALTTVKRGNVSSHTPADQDLCNVTDVQQHRCACPPIRLAAVWSPLAGNANFLHSHYWIKEFRTIFQLLQNSPKAVFNYTYNYNSIELLVVVVVVAVMLLNEDFPVVVVTDSGRGLVFLLFANNTSTVLASLAVQYLATPNYDESDVKTEI